MHFSSATIKLRVCLQCLLRGALRPPLSTFLYPPLPPLRLQSILLSPSLVSVHFTLAAPQLCLLPLLTSLFLVALLLQIYPTSFGIQVLLLLLLCLPQQRSRASSVPSPKKRKSATNCRCKSLLKDDSQPPATCQLHQLSVQSAPPPQKLLKTGKFASHRFASIFFWLFWALFALTPIHRFHHALHPSIPALLIDMPHNH